MKQFKSLSLIVLLISLFMGCTQTNEEVKKDKRICPQCNMELPELNTHTSTLIEDGDMVSFDDIGCMILYAHKNKIDLKESNSKVFTTDTEKDIDSFKAYYKINELTPMKYGFSAYENKQDSQTISFDEVRIRMLRGEHMANPKIRKRLLGY